ncbi:MULTISPECIES: VWA domain-containing protein [unclassified Motilimonas]|uniref:VWA domain-containing protein n=1 Tax=Motilimonas TaxID=1914248 RepID=UPI001E2BD463|nr:MULTISPECIES: VWA domain-containing protein [unclassified Motilimonas]MCE0558966.1 VWA domain-containing protein [Motilimonas sp. E26]MDO6527393.1 VWA domain-containing protein [Motilimonas sp. 1_MG-2023]
MNDNTNTPHPDESGKQQIIEQPDEKSRRWRLALGVDDEQQQALSERDQRLSGALSALYGEDPQKSSGRGSLGRSAPKVSKWLGDIREFFPAPVVQVVQRDAFERLGLKEMLMEPEFLAAIEADVHLIADLISLRSVMPEKTIDTARQVIEKVVNELLAKLEQKTSEAIRGAVNKSKRSFRPRFNDIDWHRTIHANLRHYQREYNTVVPEKLIGFMRQQRRLADLDEVILCVDQSGSMATSVVYSSIFAAVMASIPAVKTKLICFDTSIVDLTEELADPVSVLFGVQLGGGTDINQAIAYCENQIEQPSKTHLLLISDLYEGGNETELKQRIAQLIKQDVNVITLLALSDDGRPAYDAEMASEFATLGSPVFACTPDQFPDLMATALKREDVLAWAADQDIKAIRPTE